MVCCSFLFSASYEPDSSQFMHNGGMADFHRIRRKLQTTVSDTAFNMVQGNTGLFTLEILLMSGTK